MVDPELRVSIEAEINEIVQERVEKCFRYPFSAELGDTLEDWMKDFDRETNFDDEILAGRSTFQLRQLGLQQGECALR